MTSHNRVIRAVEEYFSTLALQDKSIDIEEPIQFGSIEYEGTRTSVQLIGVNAPETVHPSKPPERFGSEATAFIQNLLLNKFVYLDFDGDKKDKYDRLLAYVYRDSDDLFVNLEIIREGYGQTDARFPFKYMSLFKYHESQARGEKKMMWSR